ncbi:MAG: ferrous iron transporter B, partial [Clostridia bacterium]|nr:ferrous iron transporter B [Clostridia bacterium]
RLLLNKYLSVPVMTAFLCVILWITIRGANYPSELLSSFLFGLEEKLHAGLVFLRVPVVVSDCLVYGVYRTLAWVTAVMLPPMAIFFPLFTLLEDLGFLPRIAFDLDNCFKKCRSCGKQALTMCMGIGCNAAAVVGCRIIESPRERLISVLTNSFMPCNGRFALLIVMIGTFFTASSLLSAFFLAMLLVFGIFMTFVVSYILSKTLLKGEPSTFTLELPPYRMPQIKKVIVRSVLDRTLFVLGRAAAVAAPAGLVIWLLSNIYAGDISLLSHITRFLDPFAHLFGIDGTIMTAFLLGLPANEIVLPIIIMSYTGSGVMQTSGPVLSGLLSSNGWNAVTAVCVCIICLFHIPCSTTLLTIKKETGSLKYTLLSALIPMVTGLSVCFVINSLYSLFC